MTDLSRLEIEDMIEALIAMLDDADADCDLEDADTGIGDAAGLIDYFGRQQVA